MRLDPAASLGVPAHVTGLLPFAALSSIHDGGLNRTEETALATQPLSPGLTIVAAG